MRQNLEDLKLLKLLNACSPEDKAPLVNYITDNGDGRLLLDSDVRKKLVSAKKSGRFGSDIDELLIEEIQRFGGNTWINVVRGEGVSYEEVVQDVASKVGAKSPKGRDCEAMERAIIAKVIKEAWGKMSPEEQEAIANSMHIPAKGPAALAALLAAAELGGFATFRLAAIVANAVARQLIGQGLTFGANAVLMQGLGAIVGPIGWAVTALWMAADLAGPAYRVTVPCVLHIAYLRQKAAIKNITFCPDGHPQTDPNAKFCSTCGAPIGAARLQM